VEANAALVRRYQSDLEVAELPGREAQIKAQTQVVAASRAALAAGDLETSAKDRWQPPATD
jgi:HlyD family secretion protein